MRRGGNSATDSRRQASGCSRITTPPRVCSAPTASGSSLRTWVRRSIWRWRPRTRATRRFIPSATRRASSAATAPTSSISRRGSTAGRHTASSASGGLHASSTSPCRGRDPTAPAFFTNRSEMCRRRICSAGSSSPHPTAVSRYTSAGNDRTRIGCPRQPAHENCSSARVSTAGTSARRKCGSSASTWTPPNRCPRRRR